VIKLLVDDPHKAFDALQREGFSAFLKQVIPVVMDDRPGGLPPRMPYPGRERRERRGRLRLRLPGPQDGHPGGGGRKDPEAEEILRARGLEFLTDDELYSL